MPTTRVWMSPQRAMMKTMPAATHSNAPQRPATHLSLQKQLSFAEAHKAQHNGTNRSNRLLAAHKVGSGYLRRGFSVDRSLESVREGTQKSAASYETPSKRLTKPAKAGSDRPNLLKSQKYIESSELGFVRAGSTSSILKSLDYELKQVNSQLEQRYNCKRVCEPVGATNITGAENIHKLKSLPTPCENQTNLDNSTPTLKSDSSKVNLNIVLSHVINFKQTNSNESNNSDVESCSERVEPKRKSIYPVCTQRTDLLDRARIEQAASISGNATLTNAVATIPNSTLTANVTVHQRRAQFRRSRNLTINTSTNAANVITDINQIEPSAFISSASNNSGSSILNTSPSQVVQRRQPLVRAMSAPVRSRSLDENSKGIFTVQKRKLRRRKLITHNASGCGKNDLDTLGEGVGAGRVVKNDILFDLNTISGKKTSLSRTRSTLAVDVITLVSLVSSEGSDSEKEDSAPETVRGNAARSRSSGAPSLRKTGKSVSFQENYPPNFQLATKEYSHMIRRGSIVPFTARLRSNRPPTAPPVSIFMHDSNATNIMPTSPTENVERNNSNNDSNANLVADEHSSPKDATVLGCDGGKQNEEYNYPEYVCSLKERECWKLYRKMSIKGVSVSYETVLRGMLTPTEFRQVQKQREIEEAKARVLEEEKEVTLEVQTHTSAVDRLTQKLLKM
ncbi:uncharacterized protein [Eurosta solidaginis]|uniref:uncharacterized protein n=1 Tax=Eurosta solidaginis TaxID=178769 RepID=UPI0035312FFE